MTTNLFFIANVKQLRTGGSFRILLPFSRTSWGVGVLNSATFNSFHNWVELGTILDGLPNFGGFEPPPPRYATGHVAYMGEKTYVHETHITDEICGKHERDHKCGHSARGRDEYGGGQHRCERRYMVMCQTWERYMEHAAQMGEIRQMGLWHS